MEGHLVIAHKVQHRLYINYQLDALIIIHS